MSHFKLRTVLNVAVEWYTNNTKNRLLVSRSHTYKIG